MKGNTLTDDTKQNDHKNNYAPITDDIKEFGLVVFINQISIPVSDLNLENVNLKHE